MKVRTRATVAIAATAAALIGVSAPAYASVSARPTTAESARTITMSDSGRMITASGYIVAGIYNNDRWGWLACTLAGVGMKLAGQASDWYCAVDDQSGALFLWVRV
jgi:hypothetical protein